MTDWHDSPNILKRIAWQIGNEIHVLWCHLTPGLGIPERVSWADVLRGPR